MAGLYIVRDSLDTGKPSNPLKLPTFPYELAYVIQDRMFKDNGDVFYPAFPGDPFYEDFITGEGAELPQDKFPNGGPTAIAEFFGDVMTVNGKIWPKVEVQPRNYRIRVLNGCDSRFLVVQFSKVRLGETELPEDAELLSFTVVGTDHGIANKAQTMDTLVVEPASRYDIVFDFAHLKGYRVVMRNAGPDEPYGGDPAEFGIPKEGSTFLRTDRIMAFDVVKSLDGNAPDNFDGDLIDIPPILPAPSKTRKVALFEGSDEFGRLLPLIGTAEPAADANGNPIHWPTTESTIAAGLAGKPMEGSIPWHSPTTENPRVGTTEEWEIWNVSADAHPVHLHLVFFEIIGRHSIVWDSSTSEENRSLDDQIDATGDGTYTVAQPVIKHDGAVGKGARIVNPTKGGSVDAPPEYFEDGPKDVVIAHPGEVTTIRVNFDKVGRYVWHCHILAHEDNEMMRVMQIVE